MLTLKHLLPYHSLGFRTKPKYTSTNPNPTLKNPNPNLPFLPTQQTQIPQVFVRVCILRNPTIHIPIRSSEPPPPMFEIEKIIDKEVVTKRGKVTTKYRVRWKGYRAEEDSWLT
jgi:hypothetical protein